MNFVNFVVLANITPASTLGHPLMLLYHNLQKFLGSEAMSICVHCSHHNSTCCHVHVQ